MKHGRRHWILISLSLVLFCSCSKLEAQEPFADTVERARVVVESAAARGVSVSEVNEKKGQLKFKLSDGETFTIKDADCPFVRIGLDGYWYVNGERSERSLDECEGRDAVAGIESVVEGYKDWTFYFPDGQVSLLKAVYSFDYDSVMRGVNHRGFSAATPENTLPAYRMSRLEGFTYAETDVHFTADGVPVCIHDATVDRTSNGSGSVKEMTLAQLRELDFGTWKGERFSGTGIPTLEEFLGLCQSIGLIPYIELKAGNSSDITGVVALVEKYGLKGQAKYISFFPSLLEYVLAVDPDACVGFLTVRVDEGVLGKAEGLRKLATDVTKVFVSSSDFSDGAASLCKDAGFPLEVWTIDSADIILELPPYISGVTSNKLHAGRVIQGKM